MKIAPTPVNESERLAVLQQLNLLDTSAEQTFDDLTQLAADIVDCPIAFISLIDETRQWFKSKVGLTVDQGDRSVAFCSHTILQNELFVIEDTLLDPDFSDNPLVTGEPKVRFYAGMPLNVNGQNIGTLCVVDDKPKQLSEKQQLSIKRLARQAVFIIEAILNVDKIDQCNVALADETDYFRSLANSIPAAVAYWDKDLYCKFANSRYLFKIRKAEHEVIGYHYDDVIAKKTAAITKPYMAQVLQGIPCEFELPQEYPDEHGEQRVGLCKYAPHFDQDKQLIGYFVLVTDITCIKKAQKDQKLFDCIFNNNASGILITDHQHRILSINQAALNMGGWEENELIGVPAQMFTADPVMADQIVKQLHEYGKFEGNIWSKKKNGELFYAAADIIAVKNALGEAAYHVATVIEQTESYENKSKLLVANEMLERTGKMSGTGGWEYDLTSKKVTWTDQVFVMHEIKGDVAPDLETAIQFYAPEARPLIKKAIEHCIATGEPFDLELPLITAKHHHLWVRTNGELIKKDGVGYKLAGAFQDITDRKFKETQRIQDEIKLRNTLVGEVHHRIKNNLQGVSGILSQFALENPSHADAFNQANAQLQSVAVIYGLQSSRPDAFIEISELSCAIKKNIERLWQTNITYEISEPWVKAYAKKNEAVPLALIINELMTNAAKHQVADDSVTVSLKHLTVPSAGSTDAKNRVVISISNEARNPAQPTAEDAPSYTNTQSGLALMSTLMPKRGAFIQWDFKNKMIQVSLELSYPVISFEKEEFTKGEKQV